MRILITGSRDWHNYDQLQNALMSYFAETNTLISGACPTGADRMAENMWRTLGGIIERHPARWDKHGKRAGFIRNAEMIKADPDICIAFIKNNSRGATMTADLATKAGIETIRYVA